MDNKVKRRRIHKSVMGAVMGILAGAMEHWALLMMIPNNWSFKSSFIAASVGCILWGLIGNFVGRLVERKGSFSI